MKDTAFKSLMEILLQNTKNISNNPSQKSFSPPSQKVYRQGQTGMTEGVYRFVYEDEFCLIPGRSFGGTTYFFLLTPILDGQTLVERLEIIGGGGLKRISDSKVLHLKSLANLTPEEITSPYADLQRFLQLYTQKLPALWYERDMLKRVVEE